MGSKMNCGGVAFCNLCLLYGVNLCEIEDVVFCDKGESSFLDFYNWGCLLGLNGEGLSGIYESGYEPFIAHITLFSFHHFVVVYNYGFIVSFVDVNGKKYQLPKCLFDIGYTGQLFHFVNGEKC